MRLTTQDLAEKLQQAACKAPVGSVWLHFKGGVYLVTGHSVETENTTTMIHYRRIGGDGFNAIDEANIVFARPVLSWFGLGLLEREGEVPLHIDRFRRVS